MEAEHVTPVWSRKFKDLLSRKTLNTFWLF